MNSSPVAVERVSVERVDTNVKDRLGEATPREISPADKRGGDDARTLWINEDAQRRRYKCWRSVVAESRTERYDDSPLEGPSCALELAKVHERVGGNPQLWLEMWARKKGFQPGDKIIHDMTPLVDALYYFGTID